MKTINNNTNENDYNFPKYNTEEIKEAFDCFDINKNGYIGVAELKEIFSIINEEVNDEELDEMINLADKEGDGQVNWINFYEFITGNGINEEIKLLANNQRAFKGLEDADDDDFEKKDLKIIGEKPAKVPIMELTDKTKVETSKKPITGKNIHELDYLDDKIAKREEDEYKFLSNKDNDKVVIKLNKNRNINNNNDKNGNKINITRNLIKMGEDEEYAPNDENFIAQVVKRHQKNNAEKINVVDIEDKAPKPKPLLLKKPSLPKTPEPSDDEDNSAENTNDKIRTNNLINKNINPNSVRTDMLGNNDATIEKHEPYLQMNETNSVFRENLKHDTKKHSNKSSSFKKETNSLNTSKIPHVSSGGKESNDVSSQSIIFKNSKGFNDNNSMNITDKIVPLNKSSLIKVTKSSAGSGDNIKNEIEKDDKLAIGSKQPSIKSKKESISSDISHNESKSKSKPSLISFENNTSHLDKSGSESTNIKLNPKVNSDHSINKNSDVEIVKEIPIKPKIESKSQMDIKEENKNSLLKLPKLINQIPISSTQKEPSIQENNNNNQSNSISSENLSNLEKNIDEKKQSNSPSIKEVPIVEDKKDIKSSPSFSQKSQRDNVPHDLITHIVKDSPRSNRSQSNHSIQIVDHLSENKSIELNSPNLSEKSGDIQRTKPLQINKKQKKNEKNKIKDSIILASSHKLKKIEKEKNDLNVIHISKSKEMANSVLYKPKSKKETIKALIEKEQITPVIIKKFYKKFENLLTTKLTYEEMINKFQIFNSQEAKEFFETFTSIDSSIEKSITVGDILILLLNGTNLHNEEKFKFEFLIFDSEKSNFLSKSELCHLLELNFMTNSTLEIEKRINLIIEETKKMNLFDTEVFDFDVLFEILKNKPNLFFPY